VVRDLVQDEDQRWSSIDHEMGVAKQVLCGQRTGLTGTDFEYAS
jgi:hypothetical protein